jgi:AcrR family transcriptional regulator
MSRSVKRRYDASRRQAQAAETRRHVIDTATPLFIERGYASTSMRQLAEASEVSLQTLYNTFESKFGLFSAVMDVIVVGDHEPVALADRPDLRAIEDIDDPAQLVGAIVATSTPILARLDRIYPTLRAAASSDPEVATAYQRFVLDARYDHYRQLAARLHDIGDAASATTTTRTADILWAVLSPDTYNLLTAHRSWSPAEFQAWATATLVATLLPEATDPPP